MRDSNFELLRVIAMFFIILYHIIMFHVVKIYPDTPFWIAVQYPLHIAVVLFVLISGYYGMRLKVKSVIHLIMLVFIYHIPLSLGEFIGDVLFDDSISIMGGG